MTQRKRKRDNILIPNPATLKEINVPEGLRRTLRGDVFLMHDSGQDDSDRFLIFATQENLNNLVQYREWFADSTLKVAPHLFYQIYTIHCLCQDASLLMVYFFLGQKSRPTYQRALQILIAQQEELRPGSIICDFEKVFHQALEDVFGENVNIKGCYFHLSQSIWHRIQEQNLVQMYRENEEL